MAKYKSLISCKAMHSFYENGICRDLNFVPLSSTIVELRRHRSFIKNMPAGFKIVTEVQPDNKTVISFNQDLKLMFKINPSDAAGFYGISDLKQTIAPARSFTSGCKMYFRNNGANLDYRIVDSVIPAIHQLSFYIESNPAEVSLAVTDESNNPIAVDLDYDGLPINGPYLLSADISNGSFFKKLNLSLLKEGLYYFNITNTSDPTDKSTLILFYNNELAQTSCSGFVELNVAAFATPLVTTDYALNFIRRTSEWQYLVVNRTGLPMDEIDLVITDKSGDNGSGVYTTYTFTGNPLGADAGDQPDRQVVGTNTAFIFTSEQAIPFYEKSKSGLELKKIDEGDAISEDGTTLIADLPNPDPRFSVGQKSTIYVYV